MSSAFNRFFPHFYQTDKGCSIHHWSLVDRLVQQIVLQYEDGNDPDIAPFDINFKDVIEKVINQDVIRQQKAEEMEKCEYYKSKQGQRKSGLEFHRVIGDHGLVALILTLALVALHKL